MKKNNNQNKEKEFLINTNSPPMHAIYQLKEDNNLIDYFFTSYKELQEKGYKVDYNNYKFIYSEQFDESYLNMPKTVMLEDIYTKYNINHPTDFKGHSLYFHVINPITN